MPGRSWGWPSRGSEQISAGAFLGSFAVTVLLFAVPVTMLGMVPPFAIRLRMTGVESAGNVSGSLYALSTVGSIVGTFLPVLVLIPWIGTRDTMLLFAGMLAAVSAAGLGRGLWAGAPLIILVGLAVPQGAIKPDADSIFETESPYQYIQVVDKSGTKYLKLNEGWAVHSVYNPDRMLTGGYWDYFSRRALVRRRRRSGKVCWSSATPPAPSRGILTYFYPDVQIDGVEIDPDVVDAGRRYLRHERAQPDRACGRRPAFPQDQRRELGPDRRRRFPPALHPLLSDHAGVLRGDQRPPHRRRASS